LASETSSLKTAFSSGESAANLTFGAIGIFSRIVQTVKDISLWEPQKWAQQFREALGSTVKTDDAACRFGADACDGHATRLTRPERARLRG